MTDNNPSTRRYARTLSEAFGPYTSQHVEPMPDTPAERAKRANRELIAATLLAGLAGIAGLFIVFSAGGTQ